MLRSKLLNRIVLPAMVNQPLAYQASAYQAPVSHTQSVSQNNFERYIKANDAVLRNIQSQGQSTQNQCQSTQNQLQTVQNQLANLTDMMSNFMIANTASSSGSGTLPGNTVTNLKEDLKGITTRSGVAYQGPTIPTPPKVAKQGTEVTNDQVQTSNSQSTSPVQPTVTQSKSETPIFEPVVAPFSAPMPNLKPSIPYPSRRDNERRRDQANEQIEKFYEIFKEMRMDECLALADLGASINLMPLSVWKGLLLPELTPTCITLELADRTESKPVGIAKDVKIKVGVFHFPADFVVVDFEPDPRVPLILRRCFLKTSRGLIDVHKGELTLRIENEAITYNLDQTSRYSTNYDQITANKIDVTDEACEEYSQEVLSFSDVTASGSPTPSDDPIVSTTSPKLTLFEDSDFLLFEEADAFLGLEDYPDSPKLDPSYYDPEGDILLLESILNSDPSPPLPNHKQYVPSFKEELKACEAKMIKSSIDEPPEVELKDLPPHLEYVFLEGDNKLPVIIAKALKDEEKSTLIKVLKSHKRAISWKLSDIQEVEKLLDARLIYPISDSPWVSPVHCVPKKGGFTIVANEENELILTRLVTGWRVCIDYRKLNEATCKDHFPLSFMDQMLERLARNEYYCFLDGLSGCMVAIFHDMVENTIEVFMDDFSVFRNSIENCLSRLDKMLQRCEDTKLYLNWEKSHFLVKEGIVLGHKISKNGIEVDKAKIDVIAKLPHPTSVKGVRSFLDHASFYRRFIKDFSKISRSMTHLLEKHTLFVFSEDCIQAFQTLKKKLTEAPILIASNWDLSFEFMCDASDFAIGAVLGKCHEKHFRPIHYASKTLTDAESNYTTTEKEMLAVVYAFEKFRSYMIMNKCTVHTDHSALKYLFAKKDAKARYLRWVLLLQEFDFDVIDTKGAENLAAGHLSRLENPYENVLDPKEINENFPLETLSMVTYRGDSGTPWFADFANYRAGNFLVKVVQYSRIYEDSRQWILYSSLHILFINWESHGVTKSSVENLIPIPSESEGIPEHMCDVPSHDNSPPLDVSKDQIKDFSESNNEVSSIDDDSFSIDNIDYVEASPLDSELVSSEVMEIVTPEVGGIDDDILLIIKDDIFRENLLNVNLFVSKIEALNANPTPSSDFKTKSSFTSFNSLLEETNTSDNSLPEFETFCFDVEEISSGSTTTHSDISLPEYEVFYDNHVKEISSGSTTTHSDSPLYASFIFDFSINPFPPADRSDFYEFVDELIPFISPPEYDCFLFKIEPNSRDITKDVVEDISPTKEP
nr:reverse transcriptase domain-containing protein [Tanacetum cinerariifolium]